MKYIYTYMKYIYIWVTLLYIWNTVNHLYFSKFKNKQTNKKELDTPLLWKNNLVVETRKQFVATVWSMSPWRQVQGTFGTAEEGAIPMMGCQALLSLFFSPVYVFALSHPQQPHWTSLAALRPKEIGHLDFPPALRLWDASVSAGWHKVLAPELWPCLEFSLAESVDNAFLALAHFRFPKLPFVVSIEMRASSGAHPCGSFEEINRHHWHILFISHFLVWLKIQASSLSLLDARERRFSTLLVGYV